MHNLSLLRVIGQLIDGLLARLFAKELLLDGEPDQEAGSLAYHVRTNAKLSGEGNA